MPATAFRSSSSGSPQNPQISAAGSSTASPSPASPSPVNPQVRQLVDANVAVGGHVETVYRLLPAVLALAPADCQCTAALRQLRRQAAAHKVPLYLITTADVQPAAARLARAAGQPASRIAQDRTGQVTAELSPGPWARARADRRVCPAERLDRGHHVQPPGPVPARRPAARARLRGAGRQAVAPRPRRATAGPADLPAAATTTLSGVVMAVVTVREERTP